MPSKRQGGDKKIYAGLDHIDMVFTKHPPSKCFATVALVQIICQVPFPRRLSKPADKSETLTFLNRNFTAARSQEYGA